ncbi:hypothetical protein KFE25_006953 [Diacronema lutheri]|uniref:DNA topoisomerase 2 n=2 Tax=Diacronema lutheri TaxID=2081491 RepID=A0A8J6CE91_DIALT|nr:hypothetical protein KFE25_006953 [Diacronema lutheri]
MAVAGCRARALHWRAAPACRRLSSYVRIDPEKHVLKRPAMYVGSTELTSDTQWLVDADGRLVLRRCEYVPAVLKVFDEILVNALDAAQRSAATNRIDVRIDGASARFSVQNNGPGIEVRKYEHEDVWIPELVLGNLFTGTNFDDSKLLTVGGRHGFGAKLTNIFSTEFAVETVDLERQLHYAQRWTCNMAECAQPSVRAAKEGMLGTAGLTRIEFTLDLPKLGMPDGALAHSDTLGLIRRRVFDSAALAGPGVVVTLDGAAPPARTFSEYVHACARALAEPNAGAHGAAGAQHSSDASADNDAGSARVAETCALDAGAHTWQLGVAFAPQGNGPDASLSFVNGVHTSKGGTHLAAVSDALCKAVAPLLAKALPPELTRGRTTAARVEAKEQVTPALVRAHLFFALSALVDNPNFDSQSKERLTTRASALGLADAPLSARFVKRVSELAGLREAIAAAVFARQRLMLSSAHARKAQALRSGRPNVPKLEDAILAGGSRAAECTLIVTEGDSAKAVAVAGLEVVGRETYGVLPLRGKTLNVRDSAVQRVSANAELGALFLSLGISPLDGAAAVPRKLRYGRLLLMADQDHDGSHIKGLVINMLHFFWPQLLERGDFLCQFVTPIVKARARAQGAGGGDGASGDGAQPGGSAGALSFYSLQEYDQWRRSLAAPGDAVTPVPAGADAAPSPPRALSKYAIKYYKGLGTSTSAEARDYFAQLDAHVKRMPWGGEADADRIDMAFNAARVLDRREWILRATARGAAEHVGAIEPVGLPALVRAHSAPTAADLPPAAEPLPGAGAGAIRDQTIGHFIDTELVHFSLADCARSIPSVLDGLKPSQRKVLFCCLRRAARADAEVKVSQLASSVAESTEYHHGETSLVNTIVGMAQDFVGANSVPLLDGIGQFGTRARGGQDAAAARYIYVRLSPLARLLFPREDDALLPRVEVEGKLVEPVAYVPVLPLVLLNGAAGIGTGWSCKCPAFDPMQVLAQARTLAAMSADAPDDEMHAALSPLGLWATGFTGRFARVDSAASGTRGMSTGVVELCGLSLVVRELPVGVWTEAYKMFLLKLQEEGRIDGFSEAHTERRVHFVIDLDAEQLAALQRSRLSGALRKVLRSALGDGDAAPSDEQLALLHNLKLVKPHSTNNMHFFSASGAITLYPDARAVLVEHAKERRALYAKRRAHELRELKAAELVLSNRARFAQLVTAGDVRVLGAPRASLEAKLAELRFTTRSQLASGKGADGGEDEAAAERDGGLGVVEGGEYGYLLRMPLSELTSERVAQLHVQHGDCREKIKALGSTSDQHMWERELDALHEPLERLMVNAARASSGGAAEPRRRRASAAGAKRKAKPQPPVAKPRVRGASQ